MINETEMSQTHANKSLLDYDIYYGIYTTDQPLEDTVSLLCKLISRCRFQSHIILTEFHEIRHSRLDGCFIARQLVKVGRTQILLD